MCDSEGALHFIEVKCVRVCVCGPCRVAALKVVMNSD